MERKEAIEIIKKNWPDSSFTMLREALETLIPELKDSEDERIRKELLNAFQESKDSLYMVLTPHRRESFIAWLEKQGEKKSNPVLDIEIPFGAKDSELQEASYYIPEGFHAEIEGNRVVIKRGEQNPAWSEEDKTALSDALWCCKQAASIAKNENDMGNVWYAENWLKSLKDRVQPQPKQEWGEEDDRMYNRIVSFIPQHLTAESYTACISWLKSLRPQNHWKPSDEQIEILDMVLSNESMDDNVARILRDIREQLKKLMEEQLRLKYLAENLQ